MRKREGELPAVTDGECTIPSHVVQVDACNSSLRCKRFQSSYCAKVGARAKKKKKKLEGGGGERIRLPAKRLLIFLGCRVIEKLPFRDGMMF